MKTIGNLFFALEKGEDISGLISGLDINFGGCCFIATPPTPGANDEAQKMYFDITPFAFACIHGNIDAARKLAAAGANRDYVNKDDFNPLHLSIISRSFLGILLCTLEYGMKIDEQCHTLVEAFEAKELKADFTKLFAAISLQQKHNFRSLSDLLEHYDNSYLTHYFLKFKPPTLSEINTCFLKATQKSRKDSLCEINEYLYQNGISIPANSLMSFLGRHTSSQTFTLVASESGDGIIIDGRFVLEILGNFDRRASNIIST